MRSVACTVACLGMVAAGLAREPQTEWADGEQLVSEALPESLGAFVAKAGTDRSVTPADTTNIAELQSGEADIDTIVKLLGPSDVVEVGFRPTITGPLKQAASTDSPRLAEPILIAASKILLADGTELEPGDLLYAGDTIVWGVALNAGGTEVVLSGGDGEEVVIGAGALVHFAACAKSCSTTCRSGSFACCSSHSSGTCVRCLCFPDGSQASCNAAGGPGSTSCSVGVTK